MMNLLKDRSKNIQFEAFHVFKVSDRFLSARHAQQRAEVTLLLAGVRCESEETTSNRGYPPKEQGETVDFPTELSHGSR